MRNRKLALLIVAIVALLVLSVVLPRVGRKSVVRIGSILVLSGDYRSMSEQIRDGQQLAMDQINAEPGRKLKLELVVYDSQATKEGALEKLQILDRDGVRFIAEIFGSGQAAHCLPFIVQRNMLFVSGVDTGPDLTKTPLRNFFRIIPSDTVATRQLAAWTRELGLKRAAIVYLNDTWGTPLKDDMERSFAANGGQVVLSQQTGENQDVFRPVAAALKAKDSDAVFLFIHPREAALLLREARRIGVRAQFFGTDNLTGSELVTISGAAAEGVGYVAAGGEEKTQRWNQLLQAYQREHGSGTEPQLFTVKGYDDIMVLSQAIDASGGDVNAAIASLEKLHYDGASGSISFDGNHDVVVRDFKRMRYVKTGTAFTAVEATAHPQAP